MPVKILGALVLVLAGSVAVAAIDRKAARRNLPTESVGLRNERFLEVLGSFERKNKDLVLSDSLRCDAGQNDATGFSQCDFQTSSGSVCKAARHGVVDGKYRPYTVQCLDAKNQRRVFLFRQRV